MKVNGKNKKALTEIKKYDVSKPKVALANGRIYYTSEDNPNDETKWWTDSSLSYVTLGGKVNKKILENEYIGGLYSDKNGIYFDMPVFDYADSAGSSIVSNRMCFMGKDDKVNVLLEKNAFIQAVHDGMIYYTSKLEYWSGHDGLPYKLHDEFLYRIPTSGGNSVFVMSLQRMTGPTNTRSFITGSITVEGKWIVVGIDFDEMPWEWYYFNKDGEALTKLKNGIHSRTIDIVNNKLYYAVTKKPRKSIEDNEVYYYKGKTLK